MLIIIDDVKNGKVNGIYLGVMVESRIAMC